MSSTTAAAPLPETSVLAARDPALANSDEWPEFRLNNALVTLASQRAAPTTTSTSTSEVASLLLASENHPVQVRGQLEAVSRDRAHLWLLSSKPRPTTIEVADVRSYSYGAYKDGSVGLWAAGKAGWFRIVPGKAYKAVYDEMVEAVKIIYFIVDAYKTPRKSGRGKNATILPDYTAQELFEKYAIEVMGVEKGAPEAANKMYKHRDFLLASMISEKEGMKWGKNPLYIHLTRKFAKDWKRVKQRLDGPDPKAAEKEQVKDTKPQAQHERQASLDSVSTTSSLKRKRGRPPKPANADVVSVGSSSAADSTSAAVDAPHPAKATAAPTNKAKAMRSTRSNPQPSEPEIEDSQPATPAALESDYDGQRRRKSALRLKPNKSAKGPPKRGAPNQAPADDEEADELSEDAALPPRANGSKRKRTNEAGAKTDAQPRPSKRANGSKRKQQRAETVDEGIDIPTSPSSTADHSDAVAGADSTDLPIRNIEQDLLHRSDQLQENTWTCALDGCSHKVYGPASAPETQRLIREHYALHAYDDDERVQMVKRMAEPSLPVAHLVDRVRGFVGLELKRIEGSKVAGSRYPESVKTKY